MKNYTFFATVCFGFAIFYIYRLQFSRNQKSNDFPFTYPDLVNRLTKKNVGIYQFSNESIFSCDSETAFLITVISAPEDSESRNLIRKTWGNEKSKFTELKFVVGQNLRETSIDKLLEEQKNFKDLAIINVEEDYYNLSLKTLATLSLPKEHCPNVECIAKVDSDNVIDILEFEKLCKKHRDKNEIHGYCLTHNLVQRKIGPIPNKWDIPKFVYPKVHWPKFCRGGHYLIAGKDTPTRIIEALKTLNFFNSANMQKMPEDVLFTGIAANAAGIQRISNDRIIPCKNGTVSCYSGNQFPHNWISATIGSLNMPKFRRCALINYWRNCVLSNIEEI